MLISNKIFLIVLCVILLFYSLIIFLNYLSYRFNKIQKEKEKEIKYATKYGKLLAEENPKGFFTY